jgi:hypothetical protein
VEKEQKFKKNNNAGNLKERKCLRRSSEPTHTSKIGCRELDFAAKADNILAMTLHKKLIDQLVKGQNIVQTFVQQRFSPVGNLRAQLEKRTQTG